jgi:hypothetical protein
MIFDIKLLKSKMDDARNDKALAPITNKKTKEVTTFCNLACFRLVQDLGLPYYWNDALDRPMLANEAIGYMDDNPNQFSKFHDPVTAWELANKGHLIFAALKNIPHGHIAPVYPTPGMVTSGKWRIQVPYVSNVGIKNEIMGINFAFADIPDFYAVI